MNGMIGALRPRSGRRPTLAFRLLDWLTTVVISVALALMIVFVVFSPFAVGESRISGVSSGELAFAGRLSKYLFPLERGDVVLVRGDPSENGEGRALLRIAALGGERVLLAEGRVYVDGALVDDASYASGLYAGIREEFTVPEGSFFVLPDDRLSVAGDAIAEYVVDFKTIIGELRLTLYPRLVIYR